MIYFDVWQQSPEWFKLRLGVATASCFSRIVTPARFEPSKQMNAYANQLIAELATGQSGEKFESYWMERGALMENDAGAAYELLTETTLINGGFTTTDDFKFGASPDRRIINAAGKVIGGVEIKCPSPETHIDNLLRGSIDPDYIPQVYGQMLVCDLEYIDWFSYHPDFPPALIRVERNDEMIGKLRTALAAFSDVIDTKIARLRDLGVYIPDRPAIKVHASRDNFENDHIPDFDLPMGG